jgi:hypothetical protein
LNETRLDWEKQKQQQPGKQQDNFMIVSEKLKTKKQRKFGKQTRNKRRPIIARHRIPTFEKANEEKVC